MDYKSQITGMGPMALDFLTENMIIVFNDNAPGELAELSVLHKECKLDQDIKVGDVVAIGNSSYMVTAVGEEANKTFYTMGHCTFKFTGKMEVELPGHIELSGDALPEIKVGDMLEIIFT
ncbi:PTS glucitol/sorbitol transporter subunit IIA [Sinanaerobacter chloroacetimidivorans]|uniref:PTS glucitol/sorbitol transporter subunit IIA n=1 Tax=Sinanaerobacter chloroacetimidivorans TaxID=2818044 RepID=A0A8J7W5F5_9FIRM|nr:PTS glucitol/sorbitol transporter subunit IIA [Sinanaerobacter chloroacetimidivorans]MBR0600606.1 PTS glucitol/sorbitol transporter subunit IIA [Sinanaerobacter chloroacetimidivorans]